MRFAALALALPVLASATAIDVLPRQNNQCNTGTTYCCNSIQQSNSSGVTYLAGLLGIDLSSVTGQVGVNCSPLSVIGIGGNSCTAQPVCCTGNNFSGVIVVGCSPITIIL